MHILMNLANIDKSFSVASKKFYASRILHQLKYVYWHCNQLAKFREHNLLCNVLPVCSCRKWKFLYYLLKIQFKSVKGESFYFLILLCCFSRRLKILN